MNILISTTINWNPGDDFIRFGVKNLLNNVYSDINYIHYDRNPDYFVSGTSDMGSGHKSNIMNNPIDWSLVDMVVLAGSPEFLHGSLTPIYSGLIDNPQIPLLAIGVGYSFEMERLTISENELKVLSRDTTLIITRQYDLQEKLKELLNKEIHCLPCPAIFASDWVYVENGKTLAILQAPTGPQGLSEDDEESMRIFLWGNECDIATHYIEDLKFFKSGFFTTEPKELLSKITEYSNVVSNRLHGGIVAMGAGAKVRFINTSNRVQKALEPYEKYQKNGEYFVPKKDKDILKNSYIEIIEKWQKSLKNQ
jgi:hypothetical protein